MPSPQYEVPRRLSVRATALTVLALLCCAAPAAAQDDPGGASADPATAPAATPTPAPAATTAAPAVRTLRRGMRGAAVKRLQRKLRLKADGAYGRRTARAVKRFQRRRGIRADGVARRATLQALGLVRVAAQPASDAAAVLERIAACESGGDPTAVSRSGRYRGKYQFDTATWKAVGGTGDPAAAPETEQDARAAQLYAERGTAPWPVCGPKATA